MSLKDFLLELQESGSVAIASPEEPSLDDIQGIKQPLQEMDRRARLEAAFARPPLSLGAACWAAMTLYRGCQFLVFRDSGAKEVQRALAHACPEPPSPRSAHSVDLTFRHLPELVSLASGLAPADPLVTGLRFLARAWPLSSVGLANLEDVEKLEIDGFFADRSLRQLYLDRIVARRDGSRLADPRVRRGIRENLGLYRELAPEIAALLESPREEDG